MLCLGYLNRLFLLAIVSTVCLAESDFNDSFSLRYEKGLSISTLVENTLAKSPDQLWLEALESEANALRKRSDSWVAGAASVALGYQDLTAQLLGKTLSIPENRIPKPCECLDRKKPALRQNLYLLTGYKYLRREQLWPELHRKTAHN